MGRRDITEILFKEALNNININPNRYITDILFKVALNIISLNPFKSLFN